MSYDLHIVTYDRGKHWETNQSRAYHWSFLAQPIDVNLGTKYQLRGMPGAYYHPGPETVENISSGGDDNPTNLVDLDKDGAAPQTMVTKLEIGSIQADMLDTFENQCQKTRIENREDYGGEGKWNCQSWCLGVLEGLKGAEGVTIWYTADEIRQWLKET